MDQSSWAKPRYEDYEEDLVFCGATKVLTLALLAVGGLCLALSCTLLLRCV